MKQFSRAHFLSILSARPSLYDNTAIAQPVKKPSGNYNKVSGAGIDAYTGTWDREQIQHLLRRSLFGVSYADYKFFEKLTLQQSLDVLLKQSPEHTPPVNEYNDDKLKDPVVPLGHTWINARPDPSALDERRTANLKAWWVGLMLNQDRSLTEKMTLFWSNNLATQAHTVVDSRYDYKYIALLRSHALGNYKRLVRDVTTDQAMLLHLNGDLNTVTAPNENYGRELQELFTVGKGPDSHYTQGDVEAAARVLTGWADGPTAVPSLVFNAANHDARDKQFSAFYNNTIIKGRTGADGAKETDELIDMIFKQRETAKYFCRKIYRWFVYYVITPETEKNVIDPLADILISNNFEVTPVLRALLGSVHFYDTLNMGCQIKNPVDLLIGACRQFGVAFFLSADLKARYDAWGVLSERLRLMGMEPDEPLNVAGWPAYSQEPAYYENWINSNTFSVRNALTDALVSKKGIVVGDNTLNLDMLSFTAQLPDPANADQLIEDSTRLLSPNAFDQKQKAFLKTILLPGKLADRNWTELWQAYVADTNDETNRSVVLNKLSQYYTYILQRPEYQLI